MYIVQDSLVSLMDESHDVRVLLELVGDYNRLWEVLDEFFNIKLNIF